MVLAWTLRGQQGTLIRPTHLVNGKAAWLVQLDDSKHPVTFRGKSRVGEWSLQKL